MGMIFHYRAQSTLLGNANPITKLLLLIFFCVTATGERPSIVIAQGLLLLFTMLLIKLPLLSYARDLLFFVVMALLILFCNLLATHDWNASCTPALRFLDVILLGIIFSDTTDFWDLSCALAPILDHIPFVHGWRVASMVQLAIMLVPLTFEATSRVREAQTARCSFRRGTLTRLIVYASSVMETILDKLEEVSDGLEARLFDADRKRSAPPYGKADLQLGLLALLLVATRIGL